MKIRLTFDSQSEELDLADSMQLADLKMVACTQFNVNPDEHDLFFQNQRLDGTTSLLQNNIPDNATLALRNKNFSPTRKKPKSSTQSDILSSAMGSFLQQSSSSSNNPGLNFDFSQIQVQKSSNTTPVSSNQKVELTEPEIREHTGMYNMLAGNGLLRAQFEMNMPGAVKAVEKGSIADFLEYMRKHKEDTLEARKKMFNVLMNPNSEEAKSYKAKINKQQAVEENFRFAMEHHPEAFGSVFMLYINCKVNNKAIKAFVDSGAQMSIMSADMASTCELSGLIDERFAGTAVGVGTQEILGKVHYCQLEINGQFFHNSFSILKGQKMDIILGLDFLKRHQASIDLRKNALVFPALGTEARFLNESELPDSARNLGRTDSVTDQSSGKGSQLQTSSPEFKEKINQLTQMGIDEARANQALQQAGGDIDNAMAILFS